MELMQKIKGLSLIIVLFFLQSCSNEKKTFSKFEQGKSSCFTQSDYNYSSLKLPKPIYSLKIDTILSNHFSIASLNVANSIGILDRLNKLIETKYKLQNNSSIELKIELLENIQFIQHKINTNSLEISSVTSELDCEEERASQISNFMKNKADEREKRLIIGSIIVGSVGSITAEILSNQTSDNSSTYVAIGTSVAEAVLGVLMLVNNKKITFLHTRNTPAEIWNGPEVSKTLPPSIWYYLNYKNPSDNKPSLREQLIHNWTNFGQIDSNNKTIKPIYFGDGGKYNADELQNRADMYDQIEAFISLMKQDLKQLSIEVGNIMESDK